MAAIAEAVPPRWALGMLIPAGNRARCHRCRRPWNDRDGRHSVPYSSHGAQFTLCEPCWDKSTPAERWQAHAWECAKPWWTDDEAATIRAAILAEPVAEDAAG